MEFCNDTSKIKLAAINSIKNITVIYVISFMTTFPALYFSMKNADIDNIGFILFVTFSLAITMSAISVYCQYRNHKKNYKKFVIDIQENFILEKNENIEIQFNEDCKFTKDKDGNIRIKNGKKVIFISKYLDNKTEFENIIASKYQIDEEKKKYFSDIIGWLSFVFFACLFFVRYLRNLELYLFIGIGYVLTAVYSTIHSIIYGKEIKKIIFYSIIINGVFIFIVSRNIYSIISYIITKK
ncbi:MAG: hypothetical protein Ta2B_15430 [Termitinemataceae bacterium]|nr:MAG: hypothetical protein Ta2B_15430 [Termitinemataceae bacterium]